MIGERGEERERVSSLEGEWRSKREEEGREGRVRKKRTSEESPARAGDGVLAVRKRLRLTPRKIGIRPGTHRIPGEVLIEYFVPGGEGSGEWWTVRIRVTRYSAID